MTAFSNASLRSTSCSSVTTWDIATEPVSTGRTCSTRSKTRWQQQGAASSSTQAQHTLAKHACHGPIALPMQPRKTVHNWPLGKRGEHHQKPHMRSIPISNHPRLSGCQPDMPAAFMGPLTCPVVGSCICCLWLVRLAKRPPNPKLTLTGRFSQFGGFFSGRASPAAAAGSAAQQNSSFSVRLNSQRQDEPGRRL